MKFKYYFTITAGRTGTAWLADFLKFNLDIPAIHEPLAIADFGTKMPDIRLMRTFNEIGNTEDVRHFFRRKLDEVSRIPAYAETNHTLSKCGLIENLCEHSIASETCVIVLRRNFAKQCISYINRGDFRNITIDWQWYLNENYRNNIIDFKPFRPHGLIGKSLWYAYEMDARQRFYERHYSRKLNITSVSLEDISSKQGAERFMSLIGCEKTVNLTSPKNQNKLIDSVELLQKVEHLIKKIDYDANEIIDRYTASGRGLSSFI